MAGLWGRRKREEQAAQDAQDADLAREAQRALVSVDERVRTTTDELEFAIAELGEGPTTELRTALAAVRHHLGEAFQLHQLNHDEIPDTPKSCAPATPASSSCASGPMTCWMIAPRRSRRTSSVSGARRRSSSRCGQTR